MSRLFNLAGVLVGLEAPVGRRAAVALIKPDEDESQRKHRRNEAQGAQQSVERVHGLILGCRLTA